MIKRISAVIISLLLAVILSSCGGIRVSENVYTEENEQCKITLKTPVISGLSDKAFEQQLNSTFSDEAQKLMEAFKTRISQNDYALDELTLSPIIYRGENTITIVRDVYEYNGGVHGTFSRPCTTIDTKNNKIVTLPDLFSDSKWRDVLNKKLEDKVTNEPDKYSELWEKPIIYDNQQFYIDGENLVIYYPPYELSYYARGFVEFSIPLEELRGYIAVQN